MPKRLRVALLIESSNAYARGILEGIAAFVRRHQSWSIYLPEQRRGDAPPASLAPGTATASSLGSRRPPWLRRCAGGAYRLLT